MSSRANNPTGSQQLADSESKETGSEEPELESSPSEEESLPEPLSLDTIFEILKNQRRRYVLQYLRESDGGVQLNELADQVAAWENDKPIGLVSSNERKRVYVGLYQCHLTKMDESGVIDFDQYRGSIEVRPQINELYEYLDFGDNTEESEVNHSSRIYPVSAGSALAIGAIGLAVPSLPVGLLGFLLTAVLAVTVIGVWAATELPKRDVSISATPLAADDGQ